MIFPPLSCCICIWCGSSLDTLLVCGILCTVFTPVVLIQYRENSWDIFDIKPQEFLCNVLLLQFNISSLVARSFIILLNSLQRGLPWTGWKTVLQCQVLCLPFILSLLFLLYSQRFLIVLTLIPCDITSLYVLLLFLLYVCLCISVVIY